MGSEGSGRRFYAEGPDIPNRKVFRNEGKKTVLYVDDDPSDVYLLNEALQLLFPDTRLVVFLDPADALVVCRNSTIAPDVVVLDVNMPKIGGIQLLDLLKSLPVFHSTPFAMLTTSGHSLHRKEGYAKGASEFIVKPHVSEGFLDAARTIHSLIDPTSDA